MGQASATDIADVGGFDGDNADNDADNNAHVSWFDWFRFLRCSTKTAVAALLKMNSRGSSKDQAVIDPKRSISMP